MFASTITARGRVAALDATVHTVRDQILPGVGRLDGCTGMSLLAGRRTGRCIVTTGWRTEEAMWAGNRWMDATTRRIGATLGAAPQRAEWEIGLLHRVRPSGANAVCRLVWSILPDADRIDDDLETFRMTLLPRIEELIGFRSASLLVDRRRGRTVLAVTYADREAMLASGQRADALRQDYARQMGGRITEVADLELVVAHLGVPETV
ncbi:hypothetical protein [Modestobacter sp. NPDC049651]|uniref:hypothetical protein n=1 Tax=unclassified Modestobacter TaxID=2643866 RepID=UPI0033DD8037